LVPLAPITAVVVFVIVLVTAAFSRVPDRSRALWVGVTLFIGVLTVSAGPTRAVALRIKLSTIDQTAKQVLATHPDLGCASRPADAFYGTIRPCVGPAGSVWLAGGTPSHGLLYIPEGGPSLAADMCVNHVYGPWWEVADHDGTGDCPYGFRGVPGG
jgi:hypothetical protein